MDTVESVDSESVEILNCDASKHGSFRREGTVGQKVSPLTSSAVCMNIGSCLKLPSVNTLTLWGDSVV